MTSAQREGRAPRLPRGQSKVCLAYLSLSLSLPRLPLSLPLSLSLSLSLSLAIWCL